MMAKSPVKQAAQTAREESDMKRSLQNSSEVVPTVTVEGEEYRVCPAGGVEPSYRDGYVYNDYDVVDTDPDEEIRTCDIDEVDTIVEDNGMAVGFICPGCRTPVLFHDAVQYRDLYRGCSADGCNIVVCCGMLV